MQELMNEMSVVLAQAAQGQPSAAQGGISMLLWMIPLFGIMYFMMWRPQAKKQKEHEEMVSKLKAGDKVMTTCGLFGTITKVAENRITLCIAPNVNVEFVTAAVSEVLKDPQATEEAKEAKK